MHHLGIEARSPDENIRVDGIEARYDIEQKWDRKAALLEKTLDMWDRASVSEQKKGTDHGDLKTENHYSLLRFRFK